MANPILVITDDFADLVTKFNQLSNDVGDISLLTDSANNIVTAINYRDSDFSALNASIANAIALSAAADSDQDVIIAGKAAASHTHVEADITDLDKYTQAQVNSLLNGKEDADATILKDSDIGVTVEARDATILRDSDIGVTVQGYNANILTTANIGSTVQAYNANNAVRNVNNSFSFRQTIGVDVGVASTYTTGQLEIRSPGAGDATIGFNRVGNSGAQLRHDGNGLILSGNSRTASADFEVTGDVFITSDINTKTGLYPMVAEAGLDIINSLQAYYYQKKDDPSGRTHLGFIAQDVEDVFPVAVAQKGEFLSVADRPIVAALVEAVKTLSDRVEELERMADLENGAT